LRLAQAVEDGDLLPDFAREAGGEGFDFVDGAEDDIVVEVLDIEGGDFAEDGKHFAAVVEVALELERGEVGDGERGAGGFVIAGEDFGIFRELVHVDDVREGAKFVEAFERVVAFEPAFEGDKEVDGGGEEKGLVDARVDALGKIGEAGGDFAEAAEADVEGDDGNGGEENAEDGGADADPEMRAGEPASAFGGFGGDEGELGADSAEAGTRESLGDAGVQSLGGGEDFCGVERAERFARGGDGGGHDARGLAERWGDGERGGECKMKIEKCKLQNGFAATRKRMGELSLWRYTMGHGLLRCGRIGIVT
jgi:hypothetical protein